MNHDPKQTVLAYRCPHCGNNVFSVVGVFALSGDLIKLKCDCGESELTLERTAGGKLRLSVPCFLCPNPHTYSLTPELPLERELLKLGCTCSGIDICFLGEREQVEAAVAESDAALAKLMEEQNIPDFSAFAAMREYDPDTHDAEWGDLAHFTVSDLADEGKILCNCEAGEGDPTVECLSDSALVYCRKCGATRMFPMTGTVAADAFLRLSEIDLRDVGGN